MRWCWIRGTRGEVAGYRLLVAACEGAAAQGADRPEDGIEEECAAGVDEDVGAGADTAGDELLVPLVEASDEEGAGDGERGGAEGQLAADHLQVVTDGAMPRFHEKEAEGAIAGEVTDLAEDVVDGSEERCVRLAEDGGPDVGEPSAGLIAAHDWSRFETDDGQSAEHRKPNLPGGTLEWGLVGKELDCGGGHQINLQVAM
jgi:hypothetical protein